MKKIFVMLMVAMSAVAANAQKFAHYDMSAIMPNMTEYTTASAELQKLGAQYQEEYDRLVKEYQTKSEELQKLTDEGKTAQTILQSKYQDLQKMEQSIQDFTQASQQDLQKQQSEKMGIIQDKIMAAVKKIAEAGNYVYVMDLSACAQVGTPVAFVNDKLSTDISAELKKELGIK